MVSSCVVILNQRKIFIMKTLFTSILLFLWVQFGFGQTTWYEVQTGVNNRLNCIDFPTQSVGYIGGNDTLLLKTVDGGMTWNQVYPLGLNVFGGGEHVLDLQFFNDSTGYMVVGPYGSTYKTIDGGQNWSPISLSGNLCFQEALYFFNEDEGFIGGSGCFEGELIDLYDGISLNQATMNDNGLGSGEAIVDFDFRNSNYGLAASSGGRIYRTIDGGQNWDSIPAGLPAGVPVTSVKIIDDTLAYAGYNDLGAGFGMLMSTDAGLTWAMDINSATFYYPAFYDIIETNLGHIYVGCETSFAPLGVIFENKGTFWNYFSVDQPIYAMTSYADSVVWGVGDSGYVVVNVPPAMLSVNEINNTDLEISVYPNPCFDEISVKSSEKAEKGYVYNMSGQKILELDLNSEKIDVSSLNQGVYFLSLQFSDFYETIRFVKE